MPSGFLKSLIVVLASASAAALILWLRTPAPWPNAPYDRVVGYQFANPMGLGSPFSLQQGKVNLDALPQLKRKEALLQSHQIASLLKGTFEDENPAAVHAACYDPHHIFIFYSGDRCVGAIEICFSCSNCMCWPAAPKGMSTSFSTLAAICKSLGLGTGAPSDYASGEKF